MEEKFSKKKGSLLVVWLSGSTSKFVAEVIEEYPLKLKIQEEGPWSSLKDGDFIILERETIIIQKDDNNTQELLKKAVDEGKPFVSGLKRFGIIDDMLYEILPV